jgi:hypothetical protein
VDAPRGAKIRINGLLVGVGPWRSDTMPPGRYEVSAAVPSVDGCEPATQSRTVTLLSDSSARVPLRPVGCGKLVLTASPLDADYVVTSLETKRQWNGRIGEKTVLVLPEGRYTLRVAAEPPCAPFETDSAHGIPIKAGGTERKRVPLICS